VKKYSAAIAEAGIDVQQEKNAGNAGVSLKITPASCE